MRLRIIALAGSEWLSVAVSQALGSLVQTASVNWRYGGTTIGKQYKAPLQTPVVSICLYDMTPAG